MGKDDGKPVGGCEGRKGYNYGCVGERAGVCPVVKEGAGNNKTLIVFSDDLDKALASFVIANGAASTGRKVTMFFTFWGLNVIRKERADVVKKDTMSKMFGMMMPAGSRKLSLSKMNMMGMGTRMMRKGDA